MEETLLGRIGGSETVNAIVDSVVASLLDDPRVKNRFNDCEVEVFKENHKAFFIKYLDGKEAEYEGPQMEDIYSGKGITKEEFGVAAFYMNEAAYTVQVPYDAKQSLMASFNSMRDLIVGL